MNGNMGKIMEDKIKDKTIRKSPGVRYYKDNRRIFTTAAIHCTIVLIPSTICYTGTPKKQRLSAPANRWWWPTVE